MRSNFLYLLVTVLAVLGCAGEPGGNCLKHCENSVDFILASPIEVDDTLTVSVGAITKTCMTSSGTCAGARTIAIDGSKESLSSSMVREITWFEPSAGQHTMSLEVDGLVEATETFSYRPKAVNGCACGGYLRVDL